MHLHVWVCHLISLQSAMFVSSHVVYTFSRVFVPTWNKFMEFSHSEIPQCKNDKDLLSLGLQHMNFLKNITADLDSSWSSKFERAIRRSQVNEPFNEKSSFNDRSIPVYLSVYVSMYLSIYLSICLCLSVCLSVCPSVRPSVRPSTHPHPWLWRWLPHRLSKRQLLSATTVLFRTTFTCTIKLNLLLKHSFSCLMLKGQARITCIFPRISFFPCLWVWIPFRPLSTW